MRRFRRRFLPAVVMLVLSVPIAALLGAKAVLQAFIESITAILVLPVETAIDVYQTDSMAEMLELRRRRESEES